MITGFFYKKVYFKQLLSTALFLSLVVPFIFLCSGRVSAATPKELGESTKLAAYWPMDEGSGTKVNDVAIDDAIANTGTLNGASWTSGVIGKALRFTGNSNSVVSMPSSSELDIPGNISVSVWFKLDKALSQQTSDIPIFFSNQNVASKLGYLLYANKPMNSLEFRVCNGTTYNTATTRASNLALGQWHHLVGTYDGTNLRIYLNGSLKNVKPLTGGIAITGNPYSYIGSYFIGWMDEVRIYNTALTSDEVKGIYKGVKNPWREDINKLFETPAVTWIDNTGPDRTLIYDNTAYQGKMARVFAYYSIPSDYTGGKIPAMVLLHGGVTGEPGEGAGFKQWAQDWASCGYAAIAIDMRGMEEPDTKMIDGRPWTSEAKLETDVTPYLIRDSFHYHITAAAIRAISFLISRPEVDTSKIGALGISWGGFNVCNLAGVDNRLKLAVSAYGCGFLSENSEWQKQTLESPPRVFSLTWKQNLDPSNYLSNVTIPMYWITGNNDAYFPMDSHSKSYNLTKGSFKLSLKYNMTHSHDEIWDRTAEVRRFVDSYFFAPTENKVPLLKIMSMNYTPTSITAFWSTPAGSPASAVSVVKYAVLDYTEDSNWSENYGNITWNRNFDNYIDTARKKVTASIPDTAVVAYLCLYDQYWSCVSTRYIELK